MESRGAVRSCNYSTRLDWCKSLNILHPAVVRIFDEQAAHIEAEASGFGGLRRSSWKPVDEGTHVLESCFPESDDNSISKQLPIQWKETNLEKKSLLVSFTLFWFGSAIGNLLLLLGFRAESRSGKRRPYVHQISLVVSDIVSTTVGLAFQIYELLKVYDFLSCRNQRWPFNRMAFQSGFPLVNQALLIGITLDRIDALRAPFRYDTEVNHGRRAAVMNAVSYTVCLGMGWLFAANIFELREPFLTTINDRKNLPHLQQMTINSNISSNNRQPYIMQRFSRLRPLGSEQISPILSPNFFDDRRKPLNYRRETQALFCITTLLSRVDRFRLYSADHKCYFVNKRRGCHRPCAGCMRAFCGHNRNHLTYTLFFSGVCMLMSIALLGLGTWLVSAYRKSRQEAAKFDRESSQRHLPPINSSVKDHNNQRHEKEDAAHSSKKPPSPSPSVDPGCSSTKKDLTHGGHQPPRVAAQSRENQSDDAPKTSQGRLSLRRQTRKQAAAYNRSDRTRVLTVVVVVEVVCAFAFSLSFSVHFLFDFARGFILHKWPLSVGSVAIVRDVTDILSRIFCCLSYALNLPLFLLLSRNFRQVLKEMLKF